MDYKHTFLAGFFGLCAILLASGCSGNVQGGGTVSFPDGTPLDRGIVRFSNNQYQYTGDIRPDGKYRLGGLKPGDGLPPGTYQVVVIEVYDDNEVSILDAKYESPTTSGISFEVVKGRKEPFDITVERSHTPRIPPPRPPADGRQ